MNLQKVSDFNIFQFDEYRLSRITKDEYLFNTYSYSIFLKKEIEISMFVPIDEKGRYLMLDSSYFGVLEVDMGRYIEAVQNMLFRDFKVTDHEDSHISIVYKNLSLQYDFKSKNFLNNKLLIEDLIKFELELTIKAESLIFSPTL